MSSLLTIYRAVLYDKDSMIRDWNIARYDCAGLLRTGHHNGTWSSEGPQVKPVDSNQTAQSVSSTRMPQNRLSLSHPTRYGCTKHCYDLNVDDPNKIM